MRALEIASALGVDRPSAQRPTIAYGRVLAGQSVALGRAPSDDVAPTGASGARLQPVDCRADSTDCHVNHEVASLNVVNLNSRVLWSYK